MEVVKSRSVMLTNIEVLKLLQEIRADEKRQKKPRIQSLSTILYETTQFLEKTPCATQDMKMIEKLFDEVKPFQLTKAETLQLLNLRPVSPVEIQLIVEECEERLSEQQVEELIRIVAETIPDRKSEPTRSELGWAVTGDPLTVPGFVQAGKDAMPHNGTTGTVFLQPTRALIDYAARDSAWTMWIAMNLVLRSPPDEVPKEGETFFKTMKEFFSVGQVAVKTLAGPGFLRMELPGLQLQAFVRVVREFMHRVNSRVTNVDLCLWTHLWDRELKPWFAIAVEDISHMPNLKPESFFFLLQLTLLEFGKRWRVCGVRARTDRAQGRPKRWFTEVIPGEDKGPVLKQARLEKERQKKRTHSIRTPEARTERNRDRKRRDEIRELKDRREKIQKQIRDIDRAEKKNHDDEGKSLKDSTGRRQRRDNLRHKDRRP